MKSLLYCVLALASVIAVYGRHEQYEGHQLFRIKGPNKEIASLEGLLDILTAQPADGEQPGEQPGELEALIKLSPSEKQQWFEYFDVHGIISTKISDNLAEILREQDVEIKSARDNASGGRFNMTWDAYYRAEEINDYLDAIGAEYPDLVTVINAGLSYEGRQIKFVQISTTRFEVLRKPVIIIDATVHAREWVTAPVALYLIHQLVVERSDQRLLDQIDWIIMPMANPDGYEYTMDEDRMWRKTRSRSHEGSDECPGVDANRNFDFHWGTVPAASNPCAITFEGPSPFSEPEVRIIRDAVLRTLDRSQMYISLHSFGNMILYSWGNNGTLPPNGLALHVTGVAMATAIEELALPEARRYVVGNGAQILYYTSGTSRDWTRAVGIPLTYVFELPGYTYGFLVPPTYVPQIVKETYAGLAAGAHHVLDNL